jgi:hypothetical protein
LSELSLVRARFKIARGRPKVKSLTCFAPEHHCGTAALLVRTLPRALSLQDCAWSKVVDRKSKVMTSFAPEHHCDTTASLVRTLPRRARFRIGRKGGRERGRERGLERGMKRGRAAPRHCSCEILKLSFVRSRFKIARG